MHRHHYHRSGKVCFYLRHRLLPGSLTHLRMWTLARNTPCAVLDANFRPYSDYERCQLLSLAATVVEVHCECGREETQRRFR